LHISFFNSKGVQNEVILPESAQPSANVGRDILDMFIVLLKRTIIDDFCPLYSKCLNVIHMIGCHLLQEGAHFGYDRWPKIWDCMFFLMKNLNKIYSKKNEVESYQSLINTLSRVINFFITYGDKVLPDSIEYDTLHYSILRNGKTIYDCCDNVENSGQKLSKGLSNLKLLVSTFTDKVKEWVEYNGEPKSPSDVMDVIRGSYSALRLQFVDDLDITSKYDIDDTLQVHLHSLVDLIRERKTRLEDEI